MVRARDLHLTDRYNHAILLHQHRDETDAVRAESLTEVMAVIVSDVIEKLVLKLAQHAIELLNYIADDDCHQLCQ